MAAKNNGALECSGGGIINFTYSPSSVRRSGGLTFNEISAPGSLSPSYQFCKGNSTVISLEFSVVLDAFFPNNSYNSYSNFFKRCCPLNNKKIASLPPTVSLSLGEGEAYMGIMQNYESSVTRYSKGMIPIEFSFSFTLIVTGG